VRALLVSYAHWSRHLAAWPNPVLYTHHMTIWW